MPELPEVETVRRGLEPVLTGCRLTKIIVRRGDLRRPLPRRFADRLAGRRVNGIGRRGKYLLIDLDRGLTLIIHLGMSGRVYAAPADGRAAEPHDHVLFETDRGALVVFNDSRRFGLMDLADSSALNAHPLLRHLAADPLGNAFNGPHLAAAIAGRASPIKALLLDQTVVAGLGNIYVCESLYRARVSPRRLGRNIGRIRAERLASAIRGVLHDAIQAGGSSLRDYVQASGELGYFQHRFQVYGREGDACIREDCRRVIRRLVQSGRSTFYCPRCQR